MWKIHFSDGSSVLYEGQGDVKTLEDDGLEISFGQELGKYVFRIWKDRLEIESSQEVDVKMRLEPGTDSVVTVDSPYGSMEMEARTQSYEKGEEKMQVQYELNEEVFAFTLEWKEQVQEYGSSRH